MSFFCMSATVVKEVKKIQKSFLWDWGSENRKIVWVMCDKVCESKDKGGLGVIDVRKFNLAILGKWIWRLKSKERSLWKDILDSKYGGRRVLRSQVHNCMESMWWRDIRKVWNLAEWDNDFDDRGRWKVGDGEGIRLWEDKWVDNIPLMEKVLRLFSISLDIGRTLSQVGIWNNNRWVWKLSWKRDFFVWESSQAKLLSQVLDNKRLLRKCEGTIDKWFWSNVEFTNFSVQVAYNILLGEEFARYGDLFVELWNLKILPSAKITALRVLSKAIATKDNILRHGIYPMCDCCPLCGVEEETVSHFLCRVSWRIWGLCFEWLGIFLVLHCYYKCTLRCLNL